MKTSFIVILSLALLMSCKSRNSTTEADSTTAMNEGVTDNNRSNTTWDQDKIKDFVDKASMGGMMEVQLGQVAQKKGMAQEVRDFGKRMEKDHGDANNKLKTALQTLSLNVPATMDKDHQDMMDKLNKKAGKEFDKDYIDQMVSDHKEDVDEFEKAQKNLPSGELKTWVDNTLPVLREHLTQAQSVQDQLKNSK